MGVRIRKLLKWPQNPLRALRISVSLWLCGVLRLQSCQHHITSHHPLHITVSVALPYLLPTLCLRWPWDLLILPYKDSFQTAHWCSVLQFVLPPPRPLHNELYYICQHQLSGALLEQTLQQNHLKVVHYISATLPTLSSYFKWLAST